VGGGTATVNPALDNRELPVHDLLGGKILEGDRHLFEGNLTDT